MFLIFQDNAHCHRKARRLVKKDKNIYIVCKINANRPLKLKISSIFTLLYTLNDHVKKGLKKVFKKILTRDIK